MLPDPNEFPYTLRVVSETPWTLTATGPASAPLNADERTAR